MKNPKTKGELPFTIKNDDLYFNYRNHQKMINARDIFLLKCEGNFCRIYLSNSQKNFLVRCQLKQIIDVLKEQGFVQVHRSYVVNLSKVRIIEEHHILLENRHIPVSRFYKKIFLEDFSVI
ncbi:MAG TPA: LytTR family transcriptional regulator [Saprospiraceae bacterium]|nr:LytTR family transcriptional regulator [Saprospiraceae bacterium]